MDNHTATCEVELVFKKKTLRESEVGRNKSLLGIID